jgi:hypothetical protein
VFDLADIGVKRAKFIRIRDMNRVCSGPPSAPRRDINHQRRGRRLALVIPVGIRAYWQG